jgi:glyceraldehyde-3-phosphate dehydrogenase/erythrose-4-phosphate dehydrogenase
MAKHRTHRRKHRRHRRCHRGGGKNPVTAVTGPIKAASRKVMPKLKSKIEGVGSKVISASGGLIPSLQRMTRRLFGAIGLK